ncbi:hypothetical protein GALL_526160 [mine drainage metagenome]|uniref:Uncharacterized protein n=1 Tax=mine drainage metagenome TaxID=410659 RepID=A0A1J5PQG2_9ZZZZ
MELNAVKSGFDGQPGSSGIFGNSLCNVCLGHGHRCGVGLQTAFIGPYFTRANLGAWSDHAGIGGKVVLVGNTAGVHELNEDFATGFVNCLSNQTPTLNLLLVVKPWNSCVTNAIG